MKIIKAMIYNPSGDEIGEFDIILGFGNENFGMLKDGIKVVKIGDKWYIYNKKLLERFGLLNKVD